MTKLRYIVFASKENCEQRQLILNNIPGSALFWDKNNAAINLFSPIKNVEYNVTIADAAKIVATETGLGVGGQTYLQKCMTEFLSINKHGNLIGFTNWLSNRKEYSYDFKGYRDRAVVRLESIVQELKNVFDCQTGIPDHCFVEENHIIELPCSSAFMMSFVSGTILSRMFRLKAANPEFQNYKNLIVLEDIVESLRSPTNNANFLRENTFYIKAVNEARYLNIILIFIVQSVFDLPMMIREGAQIVLCKRLNDKAETPIIGNMMNFSTKEQEEYMMPIRIEEGIFVDKAKGAIPIPVTIPKQAKRSSTRQEIHEKQREHIQKITQQINREKPAQKEENLKEDLAYNSRIIMNDIKHFVFDTQDERGARLSLSTSTINNIIKDLKLNGWLRQHDEKINLGKGKSQYQIFLFTRKAIEKFSRQNLKGKGSIIHAFWQYRIAKKFTQKNYKVEIEYFPSKENNE
jgi:hypothetical protein